MRIATDIGGTFTDLVALDRDGKVYTVKGDTTSPNFEQGIIQIMEKSGNGGGIQDAGEEEPRDRGSVLQAAS
ncbi:MAG: hypothetical protein LBF74_10320, partial [Treponema sp.]|nr:hypothetical protein [Treponema sp.]